MSIIIIVPAFEFEFCGDSAAYATEPDGVASTNGSTFPAQAA